jgi:hypothetical protein
MSKCSSTQGKGHLVSRFKKYFAAGAILAAGIGTTELAGTANASPVFSDTSVALSSFQHVDAITDVGAKFDGVALGSSTVVGAVGSPIGGSHAIAFSDTATGLTGPITWTSVETNFPGFSFSLSSGVLTITAPTVVSSLNPSALPTITATATDGTAVARDTLTVTAGTVIVGGANAGKVDTLTIGQSVDTVTLHGATDNSAGTVDFTTTPGGVGTTLGNGPSGTQLAAGILSSTNAVPGTYHNVTVTAKDSGGATAVDTFSLLVKGFPVRPTVAHLSQGHVISVSNNDATIGWTYKDYGTLKECATTQTFGFGFSDSGSPHIGFTCFNATKAQDLPSGDVGYWSGLAANHNYDIKLIPAERDAVTGVITDIPGAPVGWIHILTT